MKSPFEPLRKILTFYSYVGVFPASLDAGDKGAGPISATPEAWRFLPQAALALAYLLFCLSLVQWPAEGCLGEALTWDKYWTKMSTMDITLAIGTNCALFLFGTFSASSNFFSLRRYNKFLLLCKELPEAAEHSARPCLLHHALVLGAAAGVGVVTGVTLILTSGAPFSCADSLLATAFMLLVLMDFYALTSLPEMLFSASASAVAASVRASRKDYHKGGDLERFCKEQDSLFLAVRGLSSASGGPVLVSVSFLTFLLISVTYFCFVILAGSLGHEAAPSLGFVAAQLAIMAVVSKRLFHLANSAQCLLSELDKSSVALALTEVDHPKRRLADRTRHLLDRCDEGLTVLGFFSLRRGVLLALLGHTLTYLIILIEFRVDSL